MSVYQRGEIWWYKFTYAGRTIRESAKTASKTIAKEAEQRRKRELQEGFNDVSKDARKKRICTVTQMSDEYQAKYQERHPETAGFVVYTARHVKRLLGEKMLIDIDAEVVDQYMTIRLREAAAPATINGEAELLLRILGGRGDLLRGQLKSRAKSRSWKLQTTEKVGQAYSIEQKDALLAAARESESKYILPALVVAMNSALRIKEMRLLRWEQIDFAAHILTVGKSKTAAGTGRRIPLNAEVLDAVVEYARWYAQRFGELRPEWYLFPGGKGRSLNPAKPVSTLQTAWTSVREKAEVSGRWHDCRHTLITELAENGASDQTIMAIAGHVSKKMLEHYSHIRTEAKRSALDAVLVRRAEQRAANAEKRAAEEAALMSIIN